jgi:hypothetical protein
MKKQFGLILLFSLLLVSSVFGAYSYYDSSLGGFGGGDFSGMFERFFDFLMDNQYVVDAVIFLIIFLIMAKRVFAERFADDKALYIVVGIALTIGIMVYERRIQYSLIFNSAWISLLALFAFGAYMASTTKITGIRVLVMSVIMLIFLAIVLPEKLPDVHIWLMNIPIIGDIYQILLVLFFIGVLWGLFRTLFPKTVEEKK